MARVLVGDPRRKGTTKRPCLGHGRSGVHHQQRGPCRQRRVRFRQLTQTESSEPALGRTSRGFPSQQHLRATEPNCNLANSNIGGLHITLPSRQAYRALRRTWRAFILIQRVQVIGLGHAQNAGATVGMRLEGMHGTSPTVAKRAQGNFAFRRGRREKRDRFTTDRGRSYANDLFSTGFRARISWVYAPAPVSVQPQPEFIQRTDHWRF